MPRTSIRTGSATKDTADLVLPLDTGFLRRRFKDRGLKQWWVAERVGVDRRTVRRWLQGKVRACHPVNLVALARVLGCREGDLILNRPEDRLATLEDQKNAARAILTSRAMEKLGPLGEWGALEAMLKACVVETLPLRILGRIYLQLCIACWRQGKLKSAEAYAWKAEGIARRCRDRAGLGGSLNSLANLRWWQGRSREAIRMYRACLSMGKALDPKVAASACSNYGAVLWELGESEKAFRLQRRALAMFGACGQPMNRSIAHAQLALNHLERGDLAAGAPHVHASRREAQRDEYRRGLCLADLLEADLLAQDGRRKQALQRARAALKGFSAVGIREGFNYLLAAKVSRFAGDHGQARRWLLEAFTLTKAFPLERALAWAEKAHLELAMGSPRAAASRLRAAALLKAAGARKRALRLKAGMSPHVPFQSARLPV